MQAPDLKYRSHFTNLYLVAISDGLCHPAELEFLYATGARMGLTKEQVDEIIENPHKARFVKPGTLPEAIGQLYDMGQMVCADGKIHPYEVDLCKSFSRKCEIDEDVIDEVVEKLIDEVKLRLAKWKNESSEAFIGEILAVIERKKKLSPIHIDAHHRVLLPDYDLEVRLNPLAKAIYFLFLRHLDDGICLKKISEHRAELLHNYCLITNKSDNEDIARSVNDLVDVRSNSIHENRSRINQAFAAVLGEDIAANYCIDGVRGEPYKINIPAHMVHFGN